jgi:8-oxo-dGTP pyrophosphatase MutT (NUDIX family)
MRRNQPVPSERKIIPCIAVVSNNRLLLLQRGHASKYPHTWCIPGGKMEAGETPAQCAARELREETGINVAFNADDALLGDYDSGTLDSEGQPYRLRVFVARMEERPIVAIEPGFEGYGWFTLEQTINLGAMKPAARVALDLKLENGL